MTDPVSRTTLGPADVCIDAPVSDQASDLVAQYRENGAVDVEGLATAVQEIRDVRPQFADEMQGAIEGQLSPVDRARFSNRLADDGTAQPPQPQGPSRGEVITDLAQIGLDIAGIFDPTPISDGTNGIISLFRGDFTGAALSAVGMIPYLGDAAKLGKLGRWAETVANAADLARRDPGFMDAARPMLQKIKDAMDGVDINGLPLPQSAKDQLNRIKTSVDEALAPAGRQTVQRFDNAADFNRAANNATPNTRYEFGNYSYQTDEAGRIRVAEGQVDLTAAGRNDPNLQRDIGNEGRSTDVGFHIIADRFNGQTNRLNVVPGNGQRLPNDPVGNLNQGAYKQFENTVARLAENPNNRVEMRVETRYADGNASTRPDEFVASYRVNGGKWRTQTFVNK